MRGGFTRLASEVAAPIADATAGAEAPAGGRAITFGSIAGRW